MSKTIVTLLGDATHDHDILLKNLGGIISGKLSAFVITDTQPENLEALLAKKPALLVLSKMNPHAAADGSKADWMTSAREDAIVAYVEAGGSLFVWHSALATYPPEGKYIQMLGGRFFHRPPEFLKVTYTPVAGTPMTADFPAFDALDEHYQTVCDPAKATIFLNSSSAEGEAPAGWYRTFGKGKICCLAAPHPSATAKIIELEKILLLCLNWCTGNGK